MSDTSRARRGRSSTRRSATNRAADSTTDSTNRAATNRARAAAARAAVDLAPLTYPEHLPVSARREDIAAAIRDHQVVIVAGETGSGKTTQLPKICLDLGRGRAGQIGHTQPRRIAARAVAERVAEEIGSPLGETVGYQVRFTTQTSATTLVTVMTDGILLAQIQRDPDLLAYDTLIIDEAHERSLNIDFLLGYLTNLLPRRPDLKVIITSATIDSDRFARHFRPTAPDAAEAAVGGEAVRESAGESADAPLAPIIEVTGRTYPVEIRYRPLESQQRGEDRDLITGIVDACDELLAAGPGDILVFLSGEREIRDAADALTGHLGPAANDPRHPRHVEILPLFSRLSAAEQHRVFHAHRHRRIVLATNVAETSLTVPGIHYVVDPGTARISRYSKATKVQRLPIEPISKASARQRAGRAGRLADGIAIRLYSEEDFEARPDFTEPEILRTSLASVVLQMIAVGVAASPDDVARFPFVEPPDTRAIRDGVALLTELGALTVTDGVTALTPVGRRLARLPMDPRQARMIVESARHGVTREVTVIATGLSIQDPRERPTERREEADLLHRRFADPSSDLLSYLNLWEYLRERQQKLSGSAFRRLCRSEHLNYVRVREWQDLVKQVRLAATAVGIDTPPRAGASADGSDAGSGAGSGAGSADGSRVVSADAPAQQSAALLRVWDSDAIHRSVLAGLLSQIGAQDVLQLKASQFAHLRGEARAKEVRRARSRSTNDYLGARGIRFAINPGSALAKKPPACVVAAELVETNRLWARGVARIDPAWAEELAGSLAKRTHSEPHWSSRRGAAMATEKVLLYGVVLVADRPILWAKVNAEEARDLFIRHALVAGEWTTRHLFWRDNQAVLEEAAQIEARSRTRGVIADEDTLVEFYDARIPASVVSAAHFDRWWKDARRATPALLTLTLDDLIPPSAAVDLGNFPDAWPQLDLSLPLTYQFEPGTQADGVTVHIPLPLLPQVRPEGFDWLVPGTLLDLVTATIRALPKTVRRQLVPAPDAARDVVAWLAAHTPAWADVARAGDMAEPFDAAVRRAVLAVRGVDIPAADLADLADRLPPHLRMTFSVEDAARRGEVLGQSHHLLALQREFAPQTRTAVSAAVSTPRQPPGPRSAPSRPASGAFPERENLSTWPDLDTLPPHIEATIHGVTARGYPTLVAEPGTPPRAALRVLADQGEHDLNHPGGIHRLLVTELALPQGRVTSRWSGPESLALAVTPYRSTAELIDDLQLAAVRALVPAAQDIRDRTAYLDTRARVRNALEDHVLAVARTVGVTLAAARELDARIKSESSLATLATAQDIRNQLASLLGSGFAGTTPPHRLSRLPRYVGAAAHRLDKARSDASRDAHLAWEVGQAVELYEAALAADALRRPDAAARATLDQARWMIEELRVSLFAQQLGAERPVSVTRVRKLLAALN